MPASNATTLDWLTASLEDRPPKGPLHMPRLTLRKMSAAMIDRSHQL